MQGSNALVRQGTQECEDAASHCDGVRHEHGESAHVAPPVVGAVAAERVREEYVDTTCEELACHPHAARQLARRHEAAAGVGEQLTASENAFLVDTSPGGCRQKTACR